MARPTPIAYGSFVDTAAPAESEPSLGGIVTSARAGTGGRVKKIIDSSMSGNFRLGPSYAKRTWVTGNYIIANTNWPMVVVRADTQAYLGTSWHKGDDYASYHTPGRVYGCDSGGNFGYVTLTGTSAATFGYTETNVVNLTAAPILGVQYNFATLGAGEGNPSHDERYWAFLARRSANSTWDVLVYDKTNGTFQRAYTSGRTFALNSDSGGTPRLDYVTMSALGTYVIMGNYDPGGNGGMPGMSTHGTYVVHKDGTGLRKITSSVNHQDDGVLADGTTEYMTAISEYGVGYISYTRLSDGVGVNVCPANIMGYDWHVSARCILTPGWITLSSSGNQVASTTTPGHNMIIAVNLANGEIERWASAYHREGGGMDYYQSVFACPNWDRTQIFFGSAWMSGSNATPAFGYLAIGTSDAPGGTAPTITTTTLPDATQGSSYSQTLAATGDTPLTWTMAPGSNALPTGMSLNASTGAVTASNVTGSTASVTFRATNATGYDDQAITITVNAGNIAPVITTTFLPNAYETSSYAATVVATGSPAPTFALSPGSASLPTGITLESDGDLVASNVTGATATISVRATNAAGSDDQTLTLRVLPVESNYHWTAFTAVIGQTPPSSPPSGYGSVSNVTATDADGISLAWATKTGNSNAPGLVMEGSTTAWVAANISVCPSNVVGNTTLSFMIF